MSIPNLNAVISFKTIGGAFVLKEIMNMVGALKDFATEGLMLASSLTEIQNVVDTVFKNSTTAINDFSKSAMTSLGLTEMQAKQFSSTMGAMLDSSGITGDNLVKMSQGIAALSGDLSSFFNLKPEEAFSKLRAGMSGETEPLKALGINMSVANMEAYRLAQGISVSFSKMSEASKQILRYNYLLSVTKNSQGDFAKTSTSFANSLRVVESNFSTLSSKIMGTFIPSLGTALTTINKLFSNLMTQDNFKIIGDSIAKNILPPLSDLGKLLMYIMGLNKPFTGIADGADKATSSIGGLIKAIMVVVMVVDLLVGSVKVGLEVIGLGAMAVTGLLILIRTGILTLSTGLIGVFEGIARSFDDIGENIGIGFSNLGKGIVNSLSWAANSAFNALVNNLLNPFINTYNSTIGNLPGMDKLNSVNTRSTKDVYEYAPLKSQGFKDAFGKDNESFKELDVFLNTMSDFGVKYSESVVAMGTQVTNSSTSLADTFKSFTTGSYITEVDGFLKSLSSKEASPFDYEAITGDYKEAGGKDGKGTKDLKDKANALKEVTDALKEATDGIFKFGDSFEKVTYEKFSPSKLLSRTKKFFDELATWSKNLLQLQTEGINQEVIDNLRSKGLSSAGVVKGLLGSDKDTRNSILGYMQGSLDLAGIQGGLSVKHEFSGDISVTNADGSKKVVLTDKQINQILGDSIKANAGRFTR